MVLSIDKVDDTLVMARYASICTSEKGIVNHIVETKSGHDVVAEFGTFRFVKN